MARGNGYRRGSARCASLALVAALLGGCVTAGAPADAGPDDGDQTPPCDPSGAYAFYRLTALRVPQPADIDAGNPLGHNVDGRGRVCEGPDYAGGVDNSLIDLLYFSFLTTFPTPRWELQPEIDRALACSEAGAECEPMVIDVGLRTTTACAELRFRDGESGAWISAPLQGTLAANGEVRVTGPDLTLAIPAQVGDTFVDARMDLSDVIVSVRVEPTALTELVVGGSFEVEAAQTFFRDVLVETYGMDVDVEDSLAALRNLADVEVAGQCAALSVGLVGEASAL